VCVHHHLTHRRHPPPSHRQDKYLQGSDGPDLLRALWLLWDGRPRAAVALLETSAAVRLNASAQPAAVPSPTGGGGGSGGDGAGGNTLMWHMMTRAAAMVRVRGSDDDDDEAP